MSKYNLYIEDVSVEAVFNKLGGVEGAKRFLRDELILQPAVISEPPNKPLLDFIVRVDRSVKPIYPDWMKQVMHPELELAGPAEYDLSEIEQWLHDDQKNGVMVGNTIYNHLKKESGLASCLNLQDGFAIQAKGIGVFSALFVDKVVFLWGSVVWDRDGHLGVPFLCLDGFKVGLDWDWLNSYWFSNEPALRFGK